MLRVHSFLKHEEVEFFDLRSFDIDVQSADLLSRYLQSDIDIPDAIFRMEEVAVKRKYFTKFLSKYVAEEYSIQEDYSFTAVALLHYLNSKGVSLHDGFTELLKLSTSQTICKLCCTVGQNLQEKEKMANMHNYEVLKTLNIDEARSDEDLSDDDSYHDPIYKQGQSETSSEEVEETFGGVLHSSLNSQGFNPFESSDDEENVPGSFEQRKCLNSTLNFNPFDEDSDSESLSDKNKSTPKTPIECEHCKKKFSNRYNMKLHLIRRVILFLNIYSSKKIKYLGRDLF